MTPQVNVVARFICRTPLNCSTIEENAKYARLIVVIANPFHYRAAKSNVFSDPFIFNVVFGKPDAPFGRFLALPMVVFRMPTKVRIWRCRATGSTWPTDWSGHT